MLRDTVLIGSDTFETDAQRADNGRRGRPSLNVGDGCVIERAIIDKDCRIGRRVRLVNEARKADADGPNGMYYIRDGIICVPRATIIPDGMVVYTTLIMMFALTDFCVIVCAAMLVASEGGQAMVIVFMNMSVTFFMLGTRTFIASSSLFSASHRMYPSFVVTRNAPTPVSPNQ